MQKRYLVGIFVIIGLMFLLRDRSRNTSIKSESDTNSTLRAQIKVPPSIGNEYPVNPSSSPQGPPTQEQVDDINATFTEQIKLISKCFNFQFNTVNPVIEPTAENIINLLGPFVGEGVIKMEDWSQRDLKHADGSMIRIRTEMDYEDEANPVRRVQLFKLNNQGMPLLQNIDPQQSINPTETFIESLQGDAQPTSFESGNRIYYQDGEELVFVEQSGRLNSFSFAKGDKTFTCSMINSNRGNCQCM